MPEQPAPGNELVFAYGSLVHDLARDAQLGEGAGAGACAPAAARLRDHRRVWNVAMDNSLTLPGYKYYLDARDRSRPAVLVTFLNLLVAPGDAVNGMLVAVTARELAELDLRERNYERREVTESIELLAGAGGAFALGRVWTYYGRDEACLRFENGLRTGRAVVDRAYLERVHAGFSALATDGLAEFERSTDPHGCRELGLVRIEVA